MKFIPKVEDGWQRENLFFGDLYTSIVGPNGSGKSLLLNGVSFGLGNSLPLYSDVSKHCDSVDIEFQIDDEVYSMSRRTTEAFNVVVKSKNFFKVFTTEADFSRWLLNEKIGYQVNQYTGRKNQPIGLFVSAILPQIYINQDNGWSRTYWYPQEADFILDQEEEMLRATFGVVAKHEFGLREDEAELQRQIVAIKGKKTRAKKQMEILAEELSGQVHLEISTVESQLEEARGQLNNMANGVGQINDATRVFDQAILRKELNAEQLGRKVTDHKRNILRINHTIDGLNAETTVLDHNQTASSCFRAFCSKNGCELFVDEKYSFGRKLLFLKDQIKDLESNKRLIDSELNEISKMLDLEKAELDRLQSEKRLVLQASENLRLTSSLKEMTRQVIELERLYKNLNTYLDCKTKYDEFDREEKRLIGSLDEKKTRRKSDSSIKDVREEFSNQINRWVKILGTKNVPEKIEVDANFQMILDETIFSTKSEQSGSTRFRLVFAYHLAVLQTAIQLNGPHPRVLVFDSLRQHETELRDIKNAFDELEKLYQKSHFQVIMSARHSPVTLVTGRDQQWEPKWKYENKSYHLEKQRP